MVGIRSFPIIALASFLATMSAPAAKPKASAADYFPLRVGDSWTYRNTSGDSEYTLKVLSEEKQADGSMRYLVEKLAGVKIHIWFSKPSGWVLMHSERYPEHEGLEAKYDPPKRYLQSPLVPGAKWEWNGLDQTRTEMGEQTQVIGFENVTVPAGKFRAMKVVSLVTGAVTPMTKTYWYAKGVGLVKNTTEAGQIKYGSELIGYSFKKKALK
jgi:hypothetical protein